MSPISWVTDKLGNKGKVTPQDEVKDVEKDVEAQEFEHEDDDFDDEEGEEEEGDYDEAENAPQTLQQRKMTVENQLNEELKKYSSSYVPLIQEKFVDTTRFNMAVGVVIVLNALTIGFETDMGCQENCTPEDQQIWMIFEYFFCVVFIIEMFMRMYEYGWSDYRGYPILAYFKDGWCCFDFILILLNIMDAIIVPAVSQGNNSRFFSQFSVLRVIRMARLVRLVRLLRAFRELWLIVAGMYQAAKALFWVMVLLVILLYVWAIILTITVGQSEESQYFDYRFSYWKKDDYWGTVPASMYSLFQLMTRDSWSSSMIRPVVVKNPGLVVLYLMFFCIVTFGLMNIIVGVVVENTMACAKENEEKIQQMQDSEQTRVLESLKAIFEASDTNGDGTLDREEFLAGMKKKEVKERLATIDIPIQDLNELYDLLDENQDKSITINEFFKGCEKLKGVAKSRDIIDLSVKVSMYLQMATELQHGKKCIYKDKSGEPCQNRAKGRWQPSDYTGSEGRWIFEYCEKHGGYYPGQAEGPPRGMKQQGEVLERVMERLEIMDKEFLRTEETMHRRRRKRKPGPGSP